MIVSNNTAIALADAQMNSAGHVLIHSEDYINMYNEPPQNIISLHEFQKLSLDRLQVLKKIEFMYVKLLSLKFFKA